MNNTTIRDVGRFLFALLLIVVIPTVSGFTPLSAATVCLFVLVFIALIGMWEITNRLDAIVSELQRLTARRPPEE